MYNVPINTWPGLKSVAFLSTKKSLCITLLYQTLPSTPYELPPINALLSHTIPSILPVIFYTNLYINWSSNINDYNLIHYWSNFSDVSKEELKSLFQNQCRLFF